MINRFKTYLEQFRLFDERDNILLAVSGGLDSMVLWDLFEKAGYTYSVIHCNFGLRGSDSDDDENLVRERAKELDVPLFVRRFETTEHATISGISIEMAARELRYAWFEEIRKEHNFLYLATAHHQDDLLETFFVNLVRKTGIKGLAGFREKTEFVVRPLLFTNRKEIELYAKKNNVSFRQDTTNEETVFQRNFIRHNIIPQLELLNPAFRKNLAETMANLRETEEFLSYEINRYLRKITNQESENPEIFISQLLKLPHPRLVLFEWMSRYGFNPSTIEALYSNLVSEPGKQYFSPTHRLVTDRNKLIITPLPAEDQQIFYIDEQEKEITLPVHMTIERKKAEGFEILRDPDNACLDAEKVIFPLVIRRWHPGEYFQPFGMSGFKKISDFFTDEKFSLPEKESAWILYSGGKVAWIIGHRIDNRYRITAQTREVLVLRKK